MISIRNKLKRISALTLACLTAISSPLTSFADTGLGGNASGSDHGGVTTVSGGDFGVNVSPDRLGRIGIRLSLVDANDPGKVISYLPDGQTPMVVDILYVDKATFKHYTAPPDQYLTALTGDNKYSAVKTQSYTEKNQIVTVYYDELMASLGDELGGDMQPWANYHDNAYYSLGNEFTTWCVSDKDGNLKTLNGEIATKTINAQGQEVQILPAGNGSSQVIVDGDLSFTSTAPAKESYSEINSYYSSRGTAIFNSPAADRDTMYTAEVRRLALQRSKGNISDDEYETLRKKLEELKVQASASASVESNEKSFLAKLKDKFFPSGITSYAAEGNNSGNIAESGTIANSRIETLLQLTKGNTRLLQTKSMIESGNDKLTEATEDWVLLVEPIVYLTIFRSGDDRHYIIPKQYGTISNIAEALKAKVGGSVTSKAKYGWFNWKALNGPLWGALHVSDSTDKETGQTINGFKFKNGDILTTPTSVGSYVSFDTMVDWNTWKTNGDHKEKVGYGVNVYYKGDMISTSSISTWDEVNYPDGLPGPPEDPSDETRFPKETDYGENSKKFNIVKWYYYENADGTQEVVDTQSRQQTPHKIVVENEGNADSDFYWMVEKWGTSLNGDDIPEDGSTNTTFEEYYKKYKGTYSGKEPNIVTVKPDDPDKSIYVKLVMKVIPKKDIDIVRVYENTDGSTTVENELDVPYTPTVDGNSPKGGYDFEESVTTPDPIKEITTWTEVPTGTNGTTPQIPVKETDKTVYIRFTQTDDPEPNPSKLLLHENEISHQFNLSDANGGSLVDGIRKYSSVSSSDTCTVDTDPDPDDYDSCDTDYTYDYSDDWSFTITNDADYASNKTFTWAWVQTDQKDYSGNGLSESGGTGTSTPNGEIILQRTINDTVTLYPGKNGGNESKLQEMGLRAPSYTPAKARKDGATDQPTRKTWYETFTTNWQFHNANTPTAYFSPSCGHGGTDTDSHTNTGNEATLNETYSKANNTEVYGLWGRANAGLSSPDETSNLKNAKWVFNKLNFTPRKEHLKTSEIQFYPYYKMKFVSEINGAEQDAYLTSENLSKLLNVQRVDTSISANGGNSSTGNSLYLDSTQWSIHTKAQTLLANNDVQDSRSLLPSGAIYTLSDGELSGNKAPNKYIGVHLYSTYVADKSKLANTGDILNESEANAQIEAFKEEVKRVLEGYEIQMFGALGIIADEDDFQKEAVKITGTAGEEGKYAIGTSQFDKNTSKYDLKTVENYTSHTTEANRADIDIKHIDEVTYDWKLTSDADGNIRIYRDNTEMASLTKTQGVASITNPDVQEFDARTKLVTNYVAALDRNMGSDRTGNKWYNEGWDELHCKELRISYTMGFARDNNGSAGQRSAALNIKANGVLDSRTDMFNGAEEKNRTWRFLTSEKSLAAQDKNVGYIGTFNGIQVFVPGMQSLFTSKLFYTSNTSVMDLN